MDRALGGRAVAGLVLMLVGLVVLVWPSLAVADASPQSDLALLNQERAAWGLPAGITENTAWSSDCAAHDNYERLNGGTLTHQEQPGNPGYTTGGAYAGENSILSDGSAWLAFDNTFENAPIHLIQLFTPSLVQVGIDDSSGYVCVTTWPGMTRQPPAQETVTTYPGDGTSGFPTSEDAEENPFVPGDFVGIPEGTTAGREIFVYLNEPGETGPAEVTINSASLTAPSGALAIKWVDNSTGTLGPYLTGGIIIPVQPLPEGVPINAAVTIAGANGPITHSWTFTTAQDPQASVSVSGSSITFTSANPSTGQLRVFVPPESGSYYIYGQTIITGTNALDTSRLPTDTELEACVSQPVAGGYDPADACSQPFTISSSGGTGTGGGGAGSGGGTGGTGGPLTMNLQIWGLGSVHDSSGQTCSSTTGLRDCIFSEPPGVPVTFTATPQSGSTFQGWNGPCSGTSNCTFTPSSTVDLTADFAVTGSGTGNSGAPGAGGSPTGGSGSSGGTKGTGSKIRIVNVNTARGMIHATLRGTHLTCELARWTGHRWGRPHVGRCGRSVSYRHLTAGRYRLTVVSGTTSASTVVTLHRSV